MGEFEPNHYQSVHMGNNKMLLWHLAIALKVTSIFVQGLGMKLGAGAGEKVGGGRRRERC